jgi:cytochrome c oxidase subunit 2
MTMRRTRSLTRATIFLVGLLLFAGLISACAPAMTDAVQPPSALTTRGPGAAQISSLWWLMLGLGVVIFTGVVILLLMSLLRRQRGSSDTAPASDGDVGRSWIVWGGIIMPLGVLAILFVFTLRTLAAVSAPENAPLSVEIIGRQWWWEVNYAQQGITTANELHIPVGVPVQLSLESGDVIHSFWVPQLHGKMDLIPGRVNTLTIRADEAGTYRGECAEYCGVQHAHMGFIVVAQSQAEFDQWAAAQQRSAVSPQDDASQRGQQIFLDAGCAFCHTVRGLDDQSVDASAVDLGPDLTHLHTRLMIAGATLTNNRGNLAGWVVGAQHIKPGSLMPNIDLSGDDLQFLLAYLESLN